MSLAPEVSEFDLTFETQVDLSAKQYHFVKLDTNELLVACGANEKPLGVLQDKPLGSSTTPAIARVRVGGVSKLKIAEAVLFGNFLTSTSASKGEVCDAAGEEFGAKALTSGDADDLIRVVVCFGEVEATDA